MNRPPYQSFELPPVGAVVDERYKVLEAIGEGSYGWVFAVEHRLLGQTFAMKILHPRIASDPSWITRFREEAKSTSLIGHENIVFVTDFGKCESFGYYFVMEYLDGNTLDEELRGGEPLGVQRSLDIALQAAGALSAAHDLGIVHRDLKPGNVMLVERAEGDETCKLLDFGISSIVMAACDTTKLYGTPAYMAPEQAIQPDVDHRADQFSLATILYEMLTGQPPWETISWDDATPAGRAAPPDPPSALRPSLNEKLDEVVLRALEVPFEHRWPNINAFAAELVSASSVDWIPKSDPYDLYVQTEAEEDCEGPEVTVSRRGSGESLIIVLDEHEEEVPPLVTVRFRTAERLFREYRRNLLAGGLFLPTAERLPLNSQIDLCLVFEPKDRSIELRAEVVAHKETEAESTGGFGVAIAPTERDRLTHFLRGLNLGLELSQSDMLHPLGAAAPDDDLSAAEAYILSRLDEPMPVAAIRAFCSGLPFEVEQALQSLIEKRYLDIEPADLSALSETSSIYEIEETDETASASHSCERDLADDPTRFPWSQACEDEELAESSDFSYSNREVARVLSRVRYFKAQQNYFGAFHVLRRALEVSPSVAEFYYQLALLHADFRGDYPRALQALHGAIQLDPSNQKYQAMRRKFERLAEPSD